MRHRTTKRLAWMTSIVLTGLAHAVTAQVYKWVDSSGVTHYSESAPPNPYERAKARVLDIQATPAAASDAPDAQSWRLQDDQFRAREAKRKDAEDQEAKEEAKRHRQCIAAQTRLDNFERARRMYNVTEDGQRVYLDDNQRAAVGAAAASDVATYCKG